MSGVLHGVIASLKAAAAAATDSFFRYVTLLLNTSATNGAQNNTFLDSSTNNFTVTRNGDTTQGSFNPYMPSGYWSGFFDGNGDFLSVPSNAAFDLGSSDFTVECWFYSNSFAATQGLISRYNYSGSGFGWALGIVNSTTLRFGRGNDVLLDATVSAMAVGTWYHVAAVRNGSTLTTYLNGVQAAQATGISNFTDATTALQIGRTNLSAYDMNGYISNTRVVKGTAVYTAAFTPPTTPLTAITNTSLLCLQDNRFIDNSANNFTITRNGDTRISKFAPLNPPASYSTASYGGSGYFDGTGDYLTIPRSNAFLPAANTDFTVEAWIYVTAVPGATNAQIAGLHEYGTSGDWIMQLNSSMQFLIYLVSVSITYLNTTTIRLNTWTHVAVSRSGTGSNNLKVFVNGVGQSYTTNATTVGSGSNVLSIGADQNGDEAVYTGYISNLRFVNGTGLYTSNFTPPTSPLTAITNTSFLLNFTNAGIYDASTINDGQTVGNAQVSTTQAKFGTTSMYFDGTGDWLTIIDKPELRFGTAPFTVEFFVYLGATGAARGLVAKGTSTTGWLVSTDASNKVVFTFTTSTITSTAALSGSQWYHIAVVREGTGSNQTKIYIDGVNDGTGTVSTDFNQTSIAYVGANRTGGDALNGYIDELRITNGYARYTGNFTPPTAAFPTL